MLFWFKALHLIAMVTWFAGLFYMFRLFVYWVENKSSSDVSKLLATMAHRLFFYITYPSMIATLVFGTLLLSQVPHQARMGWFQLKFVLILGLIGYHLFIGHTLTQFKKQNYFVTSRQCRMVNEIPVLFLVAIVFLAVFKGF